MNEPATPTWLRRSIVATLLGGLLIVGFVILQPFLTAVAWAAILVYVAWPLHERALARVGCLVHRHANAARPDRLALAVDPDPFEDLRGGLH